MDPYIRRVRNFSNLDSNANLRYEGFCIDMLNAIAKALGFNYEIYEVEDGHFGAVDEKTGKWSGLVRELIDKVVCFVLILLITLIDSIRFI